MPRKKQTHGELDQGINTPALKNVSSTKLIKVLIVILIVISIGLIAILFGYYNTSKKLRDLSTTSRQKKFTKKEIDTLINKVNKLIVLPTDEIPTLATITDATGLSKSQSFYRGSSNGDKVLIYFKAQKAYIYSPSKNKLVNVGPVYIKQNTTSTVSSDKPAIQSKKVLDIEIRNGTTKAGLANKTSTQLSTNSDYNITTISDAVTTTYKNSVLVDLTNGQKSSLLSQLEKDLNLTATNTIPNGEKTTTADVLLIVAQ